jgi:hypothetical protein
MTTAIHPVASAGMADEGGNKPRTIRMEQGLWDDLGPAALANGHDRSSLIKQFVRWYLSVPGAQLPQRPARED